MLNKELERRIKIGLFVVMVAAVALYVVNKLALNSKFDTSYPEIVFDQEVLEVSVSATEEDLLKGVTAHDEKDGDITDSIMIESISNMLEDRQRIVTYVAFDGDNHVGKAERRIQYTDYTPVRFSLTGPLNATFGSEETGIMDLLRATDCIDGDISSRIIISRQEYVGERDTYVLYYNTFQVTNSSGEVESIRLPIKKNMSDTTKQGGNLVLDKYLMYTKVGEEVNLRSRILEVTVGTMEFDPYDVNINSDLDVTKPGVYTATYSIRSRDKGAMCDLVIVVEE